MVLEKKIFEGFYHIWAWQVDQIYKFSPPFAWRQSWALSREPGLVDRVFALHAGSRGFDSHQGHMSEDFSDPKDQDICTQWALSWKIVVSEWQSVIAVSLNVDGGVHLIKPAKLCMCTQNTTNTTRMDTLRRVCAAMVPYRWTTQGMSLRELEYTHTHAWFDLNLPSSFREVIWKYWQQTDKWPLAKVTTWPWPLEFHRSSISMHFYLKVKKTARENAYFQLFPFKSLGDQIWPCHKIGQMSSFINFKELSPRCYIPNFKATGPVVRRNIFFKVFTIYGHGSHLDHVSWTK